MFELIVILVLYILMWIAFFFHLISLDTALIITMMTTLSLPIVAEFIDISDDND